MSRYLFINIRWYCGKVRTGGKYAYFYHFDWLSDKHNTCTKVLEFCEHSVGNNQKHHGQIKRMRFCNKSPDRSGTQGFASFGQLQNIIQVLKCRPYTLTMRQQAFPSRIAFVVRCSVVCAFTAEIRDAVHTSFRFLQVKAYTV